eukprot:941285-Prorocentrum_minimum.AAC.1
MSPQQCVAPTAAADSSAQRELIFFSPLPASAASEPFPSHQSKEGSEPAPFSPFSRRTPAKRTTTPAASARAPPPPGPPGRARRAGPPGPPR